MFFFHIRRILKNPVRRLSLKDNSNKDVKTPIPRDLITTSTGSGDGIPNNNNKKQSISANPTVSSKIKVY
jgi:hypothetical protein